MLIFYKKTIFIFLLIAYATADLSKDFEKCQKEYDEMISELVTSHGVTAATSVWSILFNSLDLNRNGLVSSSELVLKLDTENIASGNEMSNLLTQSQSWINSASSQDEDQELSLNEFVDVVRETISRSDSSTLRQPDNNKAVLDICIYFTRSIPSIITSIIELSNCTSAVKKDQLKIIETDSEQMVLNTWSAVFSTIDQDRNNVVTEAELAQEYLKFMSNINKSVDDIKTHLSSFLKEHQLNKSEFLSSISTLLFGTSHNQVWINVTSSEELKGKQIFCCTLRHTRNNAMLQLKKNEKCIESYSRTLTRILGKEADIAPGFIFAVADVNKDGIVTSSEIDRLRIDEAENYNNFSLMGLLGEKSSNFSQPNLTYFLPDRVTRLRNGSENSGFELSRLSREQHEAFDVLCLTTIRIIKGFPGSTEDATQLVHLNLTSDLSVQSLIKTLGEKLEASSSINNNKAIEMLQRLINNISSTSTPPQPASQVDTTQGSGITKLTNQETTPSLSEVTSLSTESYSEVVRDVIKDLERDNTSDVNKELNGILDKLKNLKKNESSDVTNQKQNQTTNAAEKQKKKLKQKLSKEEQELFDLLMNFKKNIKQNKPATIQKVTSSDAAKSSILNNEELELKKLLQRAIKNPSLKK